MATHATLGADLGKIIRGDSVADKILNGGAAVAIDGLNQLEVEVEARWMGSDPERNLVGAAYVAAIRRFRAAVNGFRRDLIFRVARLWAFQIARPDLDSTGKNMTDILHDLTLAMRVDSKPVQQNAITTSAVTAYGTNTGDGTLVLYDENPLDKRDEERIQYQHVIFQCRQDVRRGNTTAGAEIFEVQSSLHGKLPDVKVGWNEAVDQNRITNGSFDTFTVADTPTNWTETTGAANSTEEASLVYRTGGKALKVTADGAATAYNASQAETAFVSYASQRLKPLGVYLLSVRLRRGAAADMTGTLAIQFSGTGDTPGTGGQGGEGGGHDADDLLRALHGQDRDAEEHPLGHGAADPLERDADGGADRVPRRPVPAGNDLRRQGRVPLRAGARGDGLCPGPEVGRPLRRRLHEPVHGALPDLVVTGDGPGRPGRGHVARDPPGGAERRGGERGLRRGAGAVTRGAHGRPHEVGARPAPRQHRGGRGERHGAPESGWAVQPVPPPPPGPHQSGVPAEGLGSAVRGGDAGRGPAPELGRRTAGAARDRGAPGPHGALGRERP